jgi:hypothetical protein
MPFAPSPPEWHVVFGLGFIVVGLITGQQGCLIGGPVFALLAAYRLWREPSRD